MQGNMHVKPRLLILLCALRSAALTLSIKDSVEAASHHKHESQHEKFNASITWQQPSKTEVNNMFYVTLDCLN